MDRRSMMAYIISNQSKLPAEYQEVEWIGATGTQYIDTGLGVTSNTGMKCDLEFTATRNQQALGVLQAGVGRFAPLFMDSDNMIKCAITLNNQMVVYTDSNILSRHTYEYNVSLNAVKIDDATIGTVGNIGATNNTIHIFQRNYQASPLNAVAKLYSLELYENGTKVRDLVPCYRKADTEIGLYDLVNGVFYTNSGTGTFTKGPDI